MFLKFGKIHKKTPVLESLFQHMCFLVNFAKFLRTPFPQNNSGRVLLLFSIMLESWCPTRDTQFREKRVSKMINFKAALVKIEEFKFIRYPRTFPRITFSNAFEINNKIGIGLKISSFY